MKNKNMFSVEDWNNATWEEKVKRLHNYIERCSEFCLYREMAQETLMINLAPRIYALSKKAYMGNGFHYWFEQQLGKLINAFAICDNPDSINMNDYEKIPEILGTWTVYEVTFEQLCEKVIEAEKKFKKP